jgi:hypothetical protein
MVSCIHAHVVPVFEMVSDIRLHVGVVSEMVLGARPHVGPVFEIVQGIHLHVGPVFEMVLVSLTQYCRVVPRHVAGDFSYEVPSSEHRRMSVPDLTLPSLMMYFLGRLICFVCVCSRGSGARQGCLKCYSTRQERRQSIASLWWLTQINLVDICSLSAKCGTRYGSKPVQIPIHPR